MSRHWPPGYLEPMAVGVGSSLISPLGGFRGPAKNGAAKKPGTRS